METKGTVADHELLAKGAALTIEDVIAFRLAAVESLALLVSREREARLQAENKVAALSTKIATAKQILSQ